MVQLKALSSYQLPSLAHSWLSDLCSCTNAHGVYYVSSGLRVKNNPLCWLGGEEKVMVVFPVQTLTACPLPTLQAIPLFFLLCALNTADKSLTYFSASSAV